MDSGGRGGDAHDAKAVTVVTTTTVRQTLVLLCNDRILRGHPMFWIFLEITLGLALFVFLVWWTLPKKDKGDSADN